MVAGNQGFTALGSHGARQTRGRDKSPYRSPCNPHVHQITDVFKLRLDKRVQYGVNYASYRPDINDW